MVSTELKSVLLAALGLDEWEITDETRATDVAGWDSLKHIEVIVAVERHFKVHFKNLEVLRLTSVGDLQHLLDKKLANQQ